MTERERQLVVSAIGVLQSAECGGVGPDGLTMEELEAFWEKGLTAENDAMYDTCQQVYRLLEQALNAEANEKANARIQSDAQRAMDMIERKGSKQ